MPIARGSLRLPLRFCLPKGLYSKQCRNPQPRRNLSIAASPTTSSVFCRANRVRSSLPEQSVSLFKARRSFSVSTVSRHGHLEPPKPGEELNVTIVDQSGEPYEFEVTEGDNLLDIAQANDLEMEGACGGSCACSTCHVIVEDQDYYDKMEEPEDDENDMLDLAFGLTETSRLGCQVKMNKDLNGLVVKLPSMTRNLQKSDFEKR